MKRKSSRLKLYRETLGALDLRNASGGDTEVNCIPPTVIQSCVNCTDTCNICIPPTEYVTCFTCGGDG